jgi:hypothetical protein
LIRLIISTLFSIILLTFFCYIGTGNGITSQNFIYPNNTAVFHGTSYGDLLTKWYGWWIGIPHSMHPYYDAGNAEKCSLMQGGLVWFLPPISEGGPDNNFHCNVPIGKDILIPISITECDPTTDDVKDNQSYYGCVFNIRTTHATIAVDVDGKPIESNKLEVINGKYFNVTFTKDSVQIFGTPKPGTYRALIGGLYAILHGLPAGYHDINLHVVDKLETDTGTENHVSIGTHRILIS